MRLPFGAQGMRNRRLDGLDRKIDEKNQDVLAAIKFSYAELDRRITYLETEL
jgi:hypothetical protein